MPGPDKKPRLKVALKYCGSCNPQVDLTDIAFHLFETGDKGCFERVEPPPGNQPVDILIVLCGCPRSCVDRQELRSRARHTVVVSGHTLDGTIYPGTELPEAILAELGKAAKWLNSGSEDT